MNAFIIIGAAIILCLFSFIGEMAEERTLSKKLANVFKNGNTVKFFIEDSKVFDTLKPNGEYVVLGSKNQFVRLRNLKTNVETEENMYIIYKYSDRCEVYDGERMVALFSGYDRKFYLDGKKIPNLNCY